MFIDFLITKNKELSGILKKISLFFLEILLWGDLVILEDFKSKDFRVGVFDSRAKYNNSKTFKPRVAERFEIEFFLDGGGVTTIDGKEYKL